MLRYICKRVVGVIPTLTIVVTFVFFLVRPIPGDPARQVAGSQAIEEDVELAREQLGPNKPLPQQYVSYVAGLVRGDLGTLLRTKRPVSTEAQGRYMNTVQLILLSLIWSVITGVPIGAWSGGNRSKWQDYIGMTVAVSGIPMPSFWIGFMLIMVFVVKYKLLPTTRVGFFKNLIPPSITLGVSIAAIIARFTRPSIIEVVREDCVHMARAKDLRRKTAIWKRVFRNRTIFAVAVVGLQFGFLLGGSVMTETVFTFPELGPLLTGSVNYRDYPVIQLLILIFLLHSVPINLVVDILYVVLNPEI